MNTLEIHNQAEYEANKDFDGVLIIKSGYVRAWDNATVGAWNNATVEAWGNATVEASDNATVKAWGNATVKAWGNATVEASGNATVRASDNATVRASDNATVKAWGNATVGAWDNATVEAWDNATVEAWDNATVRASDNATVKASDNATVKAWGNATVKASDNATVKAWGNAYCLLTSENAKFSGIMNASSKKRIAPIYDKSILDFITEHEGSDLVLYKSVDPNTFCDFKTGKIKYALGEIVECPDWDPDPNRQCGGGLHLSPTALGTQSFNVGKILKCLVKPEDVVVFNESIDKVRCRAVRPVAVVDRAGRPI